MHKSSLWVVYYLHNSGECVIMGLYEDETDAQTARESLKNSKDVSRIWMKNEMIFFSNDPSNYPHSD